MAKLSRREHVLVLLYGTKSCPHCGMMREAYQKLAEQRGQSVCAVRCRRREGRCGEHAKDFPVLLFYPKGGL